MVHKYDDDREGHELFYFGPHYHGKFQNRRCTEYAALILKENCHKTGENVCYGECGYDVPEGHILCGGNDTYNKYHPQNQKRGYMFTVVDMEIYSW